MRSSQPYVLVVIDMQPYFESSQGVRVMTQCQREIREAMAHKYHILFLEYKNCGETDRRLTRLVSEYRHKMTIIKQSDDGSAEIAQALSYKRLHRARLRVCGVNTDKCVYSTVAGLEWLMPRTQVEVSFDACDSHLSHLLGIEKLKQLKNVQWKEAA